MDARGLSVRHLGSGEWKALRRLRLAAVAESTEAFLVHPERERPHVDDDWRAFLRSGTWLVAEDEDVAVGMVCLVSDPETGGRYAESMWVVPGYRRRGVAALLLAEAARRVRSERHKKMFLWVLDGNDRARDFYLGQGFRPTGRRQPLGCAPGRIEEEFQFDLRAGTTGTEALSSLTR